MDIDVRKEMGVVDPLFIKKKCPDKMAAAERLASTEKHFEEWHAEINRTNTREIPTQLIAAYEEATVALCKVLMIEKEIVNMKI